MMPRRISRIAAGFCAAACALALYADSAQAQTVEEFRAVKLTNVDSNVLFSDQTIADAMDYLASIGVNAVLTVAWNGAYTQYRSGVMDSVFGVPVHPQFAGRDPLERVVIEAHRVGIEVLPWFEYGFAAWYSGTSAQRGGHILARFPSWALRSADGLICNKNGFDWMSGINPDVQRFMNALIKEVIVNYDVDGVEFSDRIPALPVEGGYDSTTVALYRQEHAGSAPPADPHDAAWMRWRADKLNQWYAGVRSFVKAYSAHLAVSTSPSLYPWSYEEYLQDSQSWLAMGIPDHFIPQVYRYSFGEYQAELANVLAQVGTAHRHKLFPGILMNIGTGVSEYVMTPEYLLQALKANRDNGAAGEAFFYYEGLRKNNNRLGDTLKATYYRRPAVMPGRGGVHWRPKALVVNEDDAGAVRTGTWSAYQMRGYSGTIMRTADTAGASCAYSFAVPAAAWYDVYTYRVPNTLWTARARYTLLSSSDTQTVTVDQSDLTKKGWQKLGTVSLPAGTRTVVRVDNAQLESGKYLTTDAVMLMINRKRSPDVVVSGIASGPRAQAVPSRSTLLSAYPNPFNPAATVTYTLASRCRVTLCVYDMLGRTAARLVDADQDAGTYAIAFDGSRLASGAYVAVLTAGGAVHARTMMLIK